MARTAEIFFPWMLLFFLTLVVLLPPQFDIRHVLPVLGYGLGPAVQGSVPLISTPYMELVAFLVLFPYVRNAVQARKALWTGVAIGGAMLVVLSLLTVLVLDANVTAFQLYPSYSLAKQLRIGHFLERLEVIVAGIWFITIYFKLAVTFYASVTTFAELFRLQEARSLYLPFGLLLIVLSVLVYPDIPSFMQFASRIDLIYSFPYAVGIPLLLLLTAAARKIREP